MTFHRRSISEALRQQGRQRARFLCEYCHAAEKWQYTLFTIDHIIPLAKGGSDAIDNLALACSYCNRRKNGLVSAIDHESQSEVALFNPRQDSWAEHFLWTADRLRVVGLTPVGRATVQALDMNRVRIIAIRGEDVLVNRHPPPDDPIQT